MSNMLNMMSSKKTSCETIKWWIKQPYIGFCEWWTWRLIMLFHENTMCGCFLATAEPGARFSQAPAMAILAGQGGPASWCPGMVYPVTNGEEWLQPCCNKNKNKVGYQSWLYWLAIMVINLEQEWWLLLVDRLHMSIFMIAGSQHWLGPVKIGIHSGSPGCASQLTDLCDGFLWTAKWLITKMFHWTAFQQGKGGGFTKGFGYPSDGLFDQSKGPRVTMFPSAVDPQLGGRPFKRNACHVAGRDTPVNVYKSSNFINDSWMYMHVVNQWIWHIYIYVMYMHNTVL